VSLEPADRTAWLEEFWLAIHALWQAQSEAGRLPMAHGPMPARIVADRRVAEPVGGRCPRPGCGRVLLRDHDGCYCLVDGYHEYAVSRPLLLDGDAVPPTRVGRW